MGSTKTKSANSHAVRRLIRGLLALVGVVAVIGLVVLINTLAYRAYIRKDLTQTGSYSLSAQTKTVLDKLEGGYQIVTLLPDDSSVSDEDTAMVYQNVRDLAEEYGRYTDKLTVNDINPSIDISATDKLFSEVAETFDDELAPLTEAINQGLDTLKAIDPVNKKLIAVLTSGLPDDTEQELTRAQNLFRAAATTTTSFGQTSEDTLEQADDLLSQTMINYDGIKEQLQNALGDYDRVLDVLIQSAEQLSRSTDTANADKERLLEAIELSKQIKETIAEPLEKMQAVESAPRFHQVLSGLASGTSVVVLGPDQVKVIPVSDMWRQDLREYQETGTVQAQYLIEEKMTGTLLSMTLEQPPMVVFITSGRGAALGQQGRFNIVAQRLESADIEVRQWNPAGQMSAMGQPTPPMPMPEPEPGQKAVWIVLPTPDPNQMANPMMMASNPRQQIAEVLRERLEAGDSAMVLLATDPASAFGMANPIADLLGEWGIEPEVDRMILEEVTEANRRKVTNMQYLVEDWPNDLPVTRALNGMRAIFIAPNPINTQAVEGVTLHPLVIITGDRLWAHSDLSSLQSVQNAKFDEASSSPEYTVLLAAEKDGTRLITSTEEMWASDDITGSGLLGRGTAQLTGAAFPGNSELFVNSVYWLSGLEDLIAASPRSQDVPRIQPMSAGQLWWTQIMLLAGLPLASLVLGLSVWAVRRRA